MKQILKSSLLPLLFAVYSLVFLYSENTGMIRSPSVLLRSFLLLPAGTLFVYFILFAIFKQRASILTFIALIWFLMYGHTINILSDFGLVNAFSGVFRIVWSSVLLILFTAAAWKLKKIESISRIIIFSVCVMIFISTCNVLWFFVVNAESGSISSSQECSGHPAIETAKPDIYYIILDGYGRCDVLESFYGIKNNSFTAFLKSRGFYIAQHSTANYPQTLLSLASSLNMEYINYLNEKGGYRCDYRPVFSLIQNNTVMSFLRNRGYKIVSFSTVYDPLVLNKADISYGNIHSLWLNQFESLFYQTTILPAIPYFRLLYSDYDFHRKRVLFPFEQLKHIPGIKGPTFTFAHILAPHPPFIFNEDGSFSEKSKQKPLCISDGKSYLDYWEVDSREYRDRYRKQLLYLNSAAEDTINAILENSQTPPVIIVQGDHGPGSMYCSGDMKNTCLEERFGILNAFLAPADYNHSNGPNCTYYDNVTPVNTFRILLNKYFETNYTIVRDRSFFPDSDNLYEFTDVTDNLRKEKVR